MKICKNEFLHKRYDYLQWINTILISNIDEKFIKKRIKKFRL